MCKKKIIKKHFICLLNQVRSFPKHNSEEAGLILLRNTGWRNLPDAPKSTLFHKIPDWSLFNFKFLLLFLCFRKYWHIFFKMEGLIGGLIVLVIVMYLSKTNWKKKNYRVIRATGTIILSEIFSVLFKTVLNMDSIKSNQTKILLSFAAPLHIPLNN